VDIGNLEIQAGKDDNLGAVFDGIGVNFAIFSANATKIELCLFNEDGTQELRRIDLPKRTGDIWHGYIPKLKSGQVYGYRVHGPHNPASGHLFNPNKLMLDPYARETVGEIKWTDSHYDFNKDNAAVTIKGRVAENLPPVKNTLQQDWNSAIFYEAHLKGFTKLDKNLPQESRGTCAGINNPATLKRLKALGVTSVEFLPVQSKVHEKRLVDLGLKNYWGYQTINFFSIESEYLKTGKRQEFRDMIKSLNEQGIEVILDVVYNHTGEGGVAAPAISFRGIDNASYYKLNPNNKSQYIDESGCGNTLNLENLHVRKMVIDSLRLLVEDGVSGFRFDLAPVLGRENGKFNKNAQFFKDIAADPVLSKIKMIAEPWDCSGEPYHLGGFPKGWAEWNDVYRDKLRSFWRGDTSKLSDFATCISGSSNIFNKDGREPYETVNMLSCHDGFTLNDTVSYLGKHNDANLEGNRDGHNNNISCNYGAEGKTDKNYIKELRERHKRNMLATLFLSQGTPMLLAGDEFSNSQDGNNNAYCQDNPLGWLNRDNASTEDKELEKFVKKLIAFRKKYSILNSDNFLHGKKTCDKGISNLQWFASSGKHMSGKDWNYAQGKFLGMFLNNAAVKNKMAGDCSSNRLFVAFNAAANPVPFKLPEINGNKEWCRIIDTSEPELKMEEKTFTSCYNLPKHSVVVFVQKPK